MFSAVFCKWLQFVSIGFLRNFQKTLAEFLLAAMTAHVSDIGCGGGSSVITESNDNSFFWCIVDLSSPLWPSPAFPFAAFAASPQCRRPPFLWFLPRSPPFPFHSSFQSLGCTMSATKRQLLCLIYYACAAVTRLTWKKSRPGYFVVGTQSAWIASRRQGWNFRNWSAMYVK